MSKYTDEQMAEVAKHFEGTCEMPYEFETQCGALLLGPDIEAILLEKEIEECMMCGEWTHQSDLDIVNGDVMCEQCSLTDAEDDE